MTIIEAVRHPKLFAGWFAGSTWNSWIVFLKVLFALPLDDDDALIYQKHTKRETVTDRAYREAWLIVGRRGGKSLIAALVAVFLGCFKDYLPFLKPGEVATIAVIAADKKQARTILRYIRGFLALPILRGKVLNDTQEAIELEGQVQIEVQAGSFRSTRGYTFAAVIGDEIAFWRSEDSANPDKEIISAVRPGLATIPNSLLLVLSSPYARKGALWTAYAKHFGKDSRVLVWQGTTAEMNPSIDPEVIQAALDEDEPAARAEFFAEFRKDVEQFVSREALDQVVILGRHETPPRAEYSYVGFVDPSGGSSDSMTLAICHVEYRGERSIQVLDALREARPPFSPEAVVSEFSELLKYYRISSVTGDRYAGEWPRERFRVHGIQYEVCEQTRSDLYLGLLPLINSGLVELLDDKKLTTQLLNLERRTGRVGKDSIDHAPSGHDDVANAAAGVLVAKPAFVWGFS